MKWTMAGLVVLGIIAAISAALLMSLYAGRNGTDKRTPMENEVAILVATHDLPAGAMVDAGAVELRKVPRAGIPEQALTTAVEAIGKIVKTSVTSGQAFNKDMFVTEGSARLASMLPIGKRAFAISLSDYAGLDGVLFPGSVVDVLLMVNASGSNANPISRTILEAVPVLAIERQTVVAKDAEKKTETDDRHGKNVRRVTLVVTSQQAAELNLAMNEGPLALAMRTPADKEPAYDKSISLSALIPTGEGPYANLPPVTSPQPPATEPLHPVATSKPSDASLFFEPAWETTIIRGSTSQTVVFPSESSKAGLFSDKDH